MTRLHIIAEGQTEELFVKEILAPHLATVGNKSVDVRCVETSRRRERNRLFKYKGGLFGYPKARNDITDWIKQEKSRACFFTTMFDLYALPNDFPDWNLAAKENNPYERIKVLENALAKDIASRFFIPYIQLHEFEALILADPQKLEGEYFERANAIKNLVDIVGKQNPELINGGGETAPSKRILKEIPEYDKVTAGVSVLKKIGLPVLRKKCLHFNEWIKKMEGLTNAS